MLTIADEGGGGVIQMLTIAPYSWQFNSSSLHNAHCTCTKNVSNLSLINLR